MQTCQSPSRAWAELLRRLARALAALSAAVALAACQSLPPLLPQATDADLPAAAGPGQRLADLPSVAGADAGLPGPLPAALPAPAAGTPHGQPPHAPLTGLWLRLASGFEWPAAQHPEVQRLAARHAQQQLLWRTRDRAAMYLHLFVAEAETRGLPTELALLPYVESALNAKARSPVGAVGVCQFMPTTGRRFKLAQSVFVDQRRDARRCAAAMFDYLQENHRRFGDWALALAAYNAGEGAVARALDRKLRLGLPTSFEALALPRETRLYVPSLLALVELLRDPARYGARLPDLPAWPAWAEVRLPADMDVRKAAALAGIPEAELRALNPAVHSPLMPKAAVPTLVLPAAAAQRFTDSLARHAGPLSSWTAQQMSQTSRLADLAKATNTSAALIRAANNIPVHHQVLSGSTLLLSKGPAAFAAAAHIDVPASAALAGVLMTRLEPASKRPRKLGPGKRQPKAQATPARRRAR